MYSIHVDRGGHSSPAKVGTWRSLVLRIVPFATLLTALPTDTATAMDPSLPPSADTYALGQVGVRHFLVDGSGEPFFSVGLNDVWPAREAQVPLARRFHGSIDAWADDALVHVQSLEFNTIGAVRYDADLSRSRTLRRPQTSMPFTVAFEPTLTSPGSGITVDGRPDIFEDAWEDRFKVIARETVSSVADNPNLIGYFLADDLDVAVYGPRAAWWKALLSRPGPSPARDLWADIIRDRHPGPGANVYRAARLYRKASRILGAGRQLRAILPEERDALDALAHAVDKGHPANWADIAAETDVDALELRARVDPRVYADIEVFVAFLAARYHEIAYNAIRAVDKNHLILGGRLPAGHAEQIPDAVVEALAPHLDVISVRVYIDPRSKHDVRRVQEDLRRIHRLSGKPILVSGWGGFHGQDVGRCPCVIPVPDQKTRGDLYAQGLELLTREPYVIGAHFDAYGDRNGVNWGLVDEQLLPRQELAHTVAAANRAAAASVLSSRTP